MHRLCVIVCVCATFVHQKRLPDQLLRCHSKNEIHSCRLTTGIPSWLPLRSRIHGPEQGDPVAGCTSICVTKPEDAIHYLLLPGAGFGIVVPETPRLPLWYRVTCRDMIVIMDQDVVRRLNTMVPGTKPPSLVQTYHVGTSGRLIYYR